MDRVPDTGPKPPRPPLVLPLPPPPAAAAQHGPRTLPAAATEPLAHALRGHAPPRLDLPSFSPAELRLAFRDGLLDLDDLEALLAFASRARGALDVSLAEGLHALCKKDRLAALGCHLDDYAREVLDLGRRAALGLARLGRELSARPLLREALRTGRVGLRVAQTVLAVATGEKEAEWVERASRLTVRALEEAVRGARSGMAPDPLEDDEPWHRLDLQLSPDDRALVDEALDLAGEVMPGSGRLERLEALAQEFLGGTGAGCEGDEKRRLWPLFRPSGTRGLGETSRRATLEGETERWDFLPAPVRWLSPDLGFEDHLSPQEVDQRLRALAAMRSGWEELVGFCAYAVRRSGVPSVAGFASFRHYVEERLGLPARAVEQRAALEERLAASPALREARRQKVSFEKLRLLSRLPEGEILAWTPRAVSLTCIDLQRALEGERERQMRARRKLEASVPRRVAVLLAAAVEAVRERFGRLLHAGKCFAVLAWHFLETWMGLLPRRKTRSREVRERDGGHCQVPGCSHAATHAHHVEFRSHGGGDEPENLVALCSFHHLSGIHEGWLKVTGRAPDRLRWFLCGKPWNGPRG